jgi:hypothetical protein
VTGDASRRPSRSGTTRRTGLGNGAGAP